jgi:hypothetical protein
MKKIVFAAAMAAASIGAAQAQVAAPAKPLRWVTGIGITAGGDKLATADYTNGTSANIKAGSGLALLAGAEYRLSPEFSVQGTVGYHIHFTPHASNGDANFSRVPAELLAYFHPNQQWRVGGGLRRTMAVKLDGSGAARYMDRDYEGATGAVVEVEYFTGPNLGIKARVVNEKFKQQYTSREVSGNHFGLLLNAYF